MVTQRRFFPKRKQEDECINNLKLNKTGKQSYIMLPKWLKFPVIKLGLQAAEGGTERADGLNSAREAASTVGLDVMILFSIERGTWVMTLTRCWRPSLGIRRRRISSRVRLVRKCRSNRPAAISEGTRSKSWNRIVNTLAASLNASLILVLSVPREQHGPRNWVAIKWKFN